MSLYDKIVANTISEWSQAIAQVANNPLNVNPRKTWLDQYSWNEVARIIDLSLRKILG